MTTTDLRYLPATTTEHVLATTDLLAANDLHLEFRYNSCYIELTRTSTGEALDIAATIVQNPFTTFTVQQYLEDALEFVEGSYFDDNGRFLGDAPATEVVASR